MGRSPRPRLALVLALCCACCAGCVRFGFGLPGDAAAGDATDGPAADSGDGPAADAGPDGPAADAGPDGPAADSEPPDPGELIWSRRLGHAGAVKNLALATDASGTVYATGYFIGAIDLGGVPLTSAGQDDIFLASFTRDGVHRWSRSFAGSGDERAIDIGVDASGNVAITGYFTDTLDCGGGYLTSAGPNDIFVASFADDGAHRWSKAFPGESNNWGQRLAVDGSGNVAVTGAFFGTVDLGGGPVTGTSGPWDLFVVSLAGADGAHRWSRIIGGDGDDRGWGIATDGDGHVHVTGSFEQSVDFGDGALQSAGNKDIFVASYEGASGAHRWSRRFGDAGEDSGLAVAVDASGDAVVLTGAVSGTVDFDAHQLTSAGGSDVFTARLAGDDGTVDWAERFGGGDDDEGRAVAVDSSGRIFITGHFAGAIDFGGAVLASPGGTDVFLASFTAAGAHRWSHGLGGDGGDLGHYIAVTPGGIVFASGTYFGPASFGGPPLPGLSFFDYFATSYDADGAHRWSVAYSGTSDDRGQAVAVDGDSNVFVSGVFLGAADVGGGTLTGAGFSDVFTASYDPAGAHRWSLRGGSPWMEDSHGIAVAPGGEVLVAGEFYDDFALGGPALTSAGLTDVFVARLGGGGAHGWSKRFGGADLDQARGVAVDPGGNAVVTGFFHGAIDFGGGALTGGAFFAPFLASLDSAGAHRWSRAFDGAGEGLAAAVDASGDVFVTGHFDGVIDLGGGALTAAGAERDLFVACFSGADGSHRWSKAIGGTGADEGLAIAVDPAGDALVSGRFAANVDFGGGALTSAGGGADVFLLKLRGGDGEHVWSLRFGGGGDDRGRGVAVSPSGDLFVTGHFEQTVDLGGGALTSAGGMDIFVASFDSDGAHRWSLATGSALADAGQAIAATGAVVAVTGGFYDRVDFGDRPLVGGGAGFVAVFAP